MPGSCVCPMALFAEKEKMKRATRARHDRVREKLTICFCIKLSILSVRGLVHPDRDASPGRKTTMPPHASRRDATLGISTPREAFLTECHDCHHACFSTEGTIPSGMRKSPRTPTRPSCLRQERCVQKMVLFPCCNTVRYCVR